MPKWTEAQKKTVDVRDSNILVSAAAGSGKTTVLIERIKKLIIEGHTDVDRFLITTFTKAASEEMKQRLETAIRAELSGKDGDKPRGEDRNFLLHQLQILPGAAIGTFHSFALDIIRQYFYLTELEPGFAIMDEVQTAIMQKDVIDQVFESRYEKADDEFFDFLRKHSSDRNDNRIKETIVKTYNSLRSIPHYMEWAKEKTELMAGESPAKAMGLEDYIVSESVQAIKQADVYFELAAELLNGSETKKLYAKAAEDAARVKEAVGFADDLDEVREFLQKNFNQMRASKDEKDAYALVKDEVAELRGTGKKLLDDIKKNYFMRSMADYDKEINEVQPDTMYMVGLIEEFECKYKEAKNEENVIDMDDVMHYAIDILEDETASKEQRERFRYIFVDEYQDSNMLQETIVTSIARQDNLFMVGDVKQSIYKWRLAEPELFLAKAKSYRSEDDPLSMVIDLNSNFRSKRNVTEAVNAVFKEIMPGYDKNAELHCMIPEEYPGYETRLHIINREDFGDDDPEREETEAALISSIIKDAHGSEIYDAKAKTMRKVRYRDIAVLSRAGSTVTEVERYLNNEGIPAYGDTGEGYFETVEIQVFINLLRVIDNMRQDIPLISVMRSAIFDFSVRDFARIRINKRDGSFCDAVREYAANGPDHELRDKIEKMDSRISLWKETAKAVPLEELVRMLLYDTGYYDYCSGLPVGRQRISNLQLIVEKAAQFERTSHSGLNGFLRYVEAMADSNTSEAEAKTISENEDVVRVMTVHKSKGLEFPVVIFTGAGKEISGGGGKGSAPMHKGYGIGLPLVNKEEHWRKKTLLQNIIGARQGAENMDEAVRILYVALTRAMDRLEIVGSVKKEELLKDVPGTRSYIDMMYASLLDQPGAAVTVYDKVSAEDNGQEWYGKKAADLLAKASREAAGPEDPVYEEINRRLSFEYQWKQEEPVKLKYSVTELNRKDHDYEVPVAEFEPDMTKHRITAAEAGTIMHLVMERIDFARARDEGQSYVSGVADALTESGKINPEERAAVRSDKIAAFFNTDIGLRAAKAFEDGSLRREKEFILEKEIRGENAVIQGIIDCWFEEEDGLVLIDYKNSYMGKGRTEEDIKETYEAQIRTYREALEGATGRKVKESYLFLFDLGKFLKID